jgi:RNA polymerase sigma-70 factor (ECF subfamily)
MTALYDTQDFIDRLKTHDSVSFSQLYDLLGKKIFNFALRITGNQEDASDITQATFFQVFQTIGNFRGESRFSTWVYAIAKNACYRVVTQRKRTTFLALEHMLQNSSDSDYQQGINESDLKNLSDQVREGCLLGLVRCLPFNQRLTFISHVLFHIPIHEVAQLLEKTDGATKLLIHRARENIKSFLCKNCSIYDPMNSCQCKNMIHFSLRQGWISYDFSPEQNTEILLAGQIETEVNNFQKILLYYSRVNIYDPPVSLRQHILALQQSQDWVILQK